MYKLVLASSSPRRIDILTMLGYSFSVRPSDCDETVPETFSARQTVETLSKRKAAAVKREKGEIILGSDTVVTLDGRILGKPHTEKEAREMLSFLSGKTHRVYTGVTVISDSKTETKSDFASVTFKNLSEKDISDYIATGECFGKAGGYAVQGIGKRLVEKTEGDFYTIVGLPAVLTKKMLSEIISE